MAVGMGRIMFMALATVMLVTVLESQRGVDASPSIMNYDLIGVCIRNCAQCKKMYGPWFEGQLCADACMKFKGKIIPDCEDVASIAPFLNKVD